MLDYFIALLLSSITWAVLDTISSKDNKEW